MQPLCLYCWSPCCKATREHLVPKSYGGQLTIRPICSKCNHTRGNRHDYKPFLHFIRYNPTLWLLAVGQCDQKNKKATEFLCRVMIAYVKYREKQIVSVLQSRVPSGPRPVYVRNVRHRHRRAYKRHSVRHYEALKNYGIKRMTQSKK